MICTLSNVAQRNYVIRVALVSALFVLLTAAAKAALRNGHLSGSVGILVAILPVFPIMGALVYTGLYLSEEKDEFQRQVMVEALLAGIGFTLSVTTLWGFLEDFTHAPHMSLLWIYPMFWIFTALAVPFVWMRYR
jgi:hypothetical protein